MDRDTMEQAGRVEQQKKNAVQSESELDRSRRKAMAVIGGTLGAASLGIGSTSVAAQDEEDEEEEEEDDETIVEVPTNEDLWPNPTEPYQLAASREQRENSLCRHMKLACSAVFMMDRDVEEHFKNDLVDYRNQYFRWEEVDVEVDYDRQTVTYSAPPDPPRTAAYVDGLGSSILPSGLKEVAYEPVDITPKPSKDQPWPMGERKATADPPEVDTEALEDVLDWVFETNQPETDYNKPHEKYHADIPRVTERPDTRAVVVLQDGDIVGERYDEEGGTTRDQPHVSWSAGKSLAPTLIGILVQEGHFDVDDPAPIKEWYEEEDDPRQEITISNIARMSSGLRFNRAADMDEIIYPTRNDDHSRPYFEALDVFEFAANQHLKHEPGTVHEYRNVNPMLLMKIVRDTVKEEGEDPLTFPQRALFDKIGARNFTIEPDYTGNWITQGHVYASARDWARFGQLYLQDGSFDGEQILPEGWADYVSTPAPADETDSYGAMFWLDLDAAPEGTFYASGARDNWCIIIPSHDMVIVRLGRYAEYSQDEFVERILDTVSI